MKNPLNLSSHCIETEIKRLHNRTLSRYFKADDAEKVHLEAILECLLLALDRLDFGRIRTAYPALSGGASREVSLRLAKNRLQILVDDQPIAGCDP